jgi:hypothetical protein
MKIEQATAFVLALPVRQAVIWLQELGFEWEIERDYSNKEWTPIESTSYNPHRVKLSIENRLVVQAEVG